MWHAQADARERVRQMESNLDSEHTKTRDAKYALEESMHREHSLKADLDAISKKREAEMLQTTDELSKAKGELVC